MLRRVAAIDTLTPHRCLVAILLAANTAASATCPPPQAPREELHQLAARKWVVADDAARQTLALALLPCLGAPDPALRDELAFTALSTWIRAKALDAGTVREIGERALAMMQAPDPTGFAPPFAALALAEVARADRLETVWSAPQRQAMMAAAAKFLRDTRDYRGFDESEGWRHAVAHGADLLMQLSLNPLLERAQLDQVLEAVAAQVLPPGHFYRYGEGERLARPLLFTARRRLHSADEWSAWMARIVDRALPTAQAPARQSSLADVHNAKAFLLSLYASLQESNDAELRARLLPGVATALRRLP
jgi:Protein of unknown function (DUF2785)